MWEPLNSDVLLISELSDKISIECIPYNAYIIQLVQCKKKCDTSKL